MKHIALILILLAVVLRAGAQDYNGHVTDANGKPLESVSVMLLDGKGKIVKFAKTDSKGVFTVKLPEGKTATQLSLVCVGYARKNLPLSKYKDGSTTAMEEKVEEIREVKVSPEKFRIQGDTLFYSVLGLQEKQDRTISDVIARIPGISVSATGRITYQGTAINKFYVDGKDMMGDDYNLLSTNLAANKVDSVQLMRNHQPVKSLRGKSFSEQAAINLVLKSDAKNVWTGTIEAGSGMYVQSPWKWTHRARLVEMFLGGGMQVLAMYKHNNVGEDVMGEVSAMNDYSDSGLLHNIGGVGTGRMGFNNTHMVATNLYKKINDDQSLRLQLSGLYDKSTSSDYSEHTYLDIGDNTTIVQKRESQSYKSGVKANLDYSVNAKKWFLSEALNGVMDFDHSNSLTTLNGRELRENVRPHKRAISNSLHLTSSPGSSFFFTASSNCSYTYAPGSLLLYNGTEETANINSWYMKNSVSTSDVIKGGLRYSVELTHTMDYKREFVQYNDTIDRANYNKNKVDLKASLSYSISALRMSVSNMLSWYNTSIGTDKDSRWIDNPSLNLYWDVDRFTNMSVSYGHSFNQSGFYTVNPVRLYTSYNMATSGTGQLDNNSGDNVRVSWNSTMPGNGFSYGANYSYSTSHVSSLYESRLDDGVYVREAVNRKSTANSHNISANLGYFFRWMHTRLKLFPSYNVSNFDLIRNGVTMRSGNRSLYVRFSAEMRPCKWFYFEESSTYSQSQQRSVTDGQKNPTYRIFHHSLNLFFQPGSWQLKITNDCSHSKDGSVNFNIYSDAQLSYKTKVYELLLTCKNLWGENKREYKSFSALGSSYSVTEYRPREIMASVIFSL